MPDGSVRLPDGGSLREVLRGLPVFDVDLPGFDADHVPGDPVSLFLDWFASAVATGVHEPHAMTLSTADAAGRPSARVLICKDVAIPAGRP